MATATEDTERNRHSTTPEDLDKQHEQLELEQKLPELQHQLEQRKLSTPTRQPSMVFKSNMREHLSKKHDLSKLPQLEVTEDGICRGFLIKQGEVVRNWKKRYFVFNPCNRTFTYYTDHTLKHVKGIIYFDAIQRVWSEDKTSVTDWSHKFYIKTIQRVYNIRAQTMATMKAWIDIVETTQIDNVSIHKS